LLTVAGFSALLRPVRILRLKVHRYGKCLKKWYPLPVMYLTASFIAKVFGLRLPV
jgi:hypothetical protein